MAAALTGRPILYAEPVQQVRGLLMRDGSVQPIQARVYEDPDVEAVRAAVTDMNVTQAAGRGRGVTRTADNPLTVWIMADSVVPVVVDHVDRWEDIAPNVLQRMAARGVAAVAAAASSVVANI
jgi:putative DNA primase/helicase